MENFLQSLEIIGTIAFCMTGIIGAIRKDLDFVGILFCGLITAIGGGIIRDSILGIPAASFQSNQALIIIIISSLITYIWAPRLIKIHFILRYLDALGLATFAILGTQKAFILEFSVLPALFLGLITAIGGGIIRDLFIQEIPLVFRKELYATGAFIGIVGFLSLQDQLSFFTNFILWTVFIFGFRVWNIRTNLNLPIKKVQ